MRPANARVAAAQVTAPAAATTAPAATVSASSRFDEVARVNDWDERLCALEDAIQELYEKITRRA